MCSCRWLQGTGNCWACFEAVEKKTWSTCFSDVFSHLWHALGINHELLWKHGDCAELSHRNVRIQDLTKYLAVVVPKKKPVLKSHFSITWESGDVKIEVVSLWAQESRLRPVVSILACLQCLFHYIGRTRCKILASMMAIRFSCFLFFRVKSEQPNHYKWGRVKSYISAALYLPVCAAQLCRYL